MLITLEEGSIGGFGSQILHHLATTGALDSGLKIRPLAMPDRFLDHDTPANQVAAAGLDAKAIVATALSALGQESAAEEGARA